MRGRWHFNARGQHSAILRNYRRAANDVSHVRGINCDVLHRSWSRCMQRPSTTTHLLQLNMHLFMRLWFTAAPIAIQHRLRRGRHSICVQRIMGKTKPSEVEATKSTTQQKR